MLCSSSQALLCTELLSACYLQVKLQSDANRNSTQAVYAMKVQMPACPWEFYICKVLQGRVAPAMQSMFLGADRLYLLSDRSVMLNPYSQHGTLQDLLNSHLRDGKVNVLMYHNTDTSLCMM